MSLKVNLNKKRNTKNKENEKEPLLLNNAHYIKDLSFENPGVLNHSIDLSE
jgi:preprotein translocase subunit SecB